MEQGGTKSNRGGTGGTGLNRVKQSGTRWNMDVVRPIEDWSIRPIVIRLVGALDSLDHYTDRTIILDHYIYCGIGLIGVLDWSGH